MKSLSEYIVEAAEKEEEKTEQVPDKKSFTFDFTDIENGEDTVKSLDGKTGVTVDGSKVTVEITKDNVDDIDFVQDILQQTYDTEKKSPKKTNSEEYAQKVNKIGSTIADMNDYIDQLDSQD